MKKPGFLFLCGMLLFSLSACGSKSEQGSDHMVSDQKDQIVAEAKVPESEETVSGSNENLTDELQIRVGGEDGQNIIFQLNDSPAAAALYQQLPLSIQVENYSHNEKIFYPPGELDISNTPLAAGPSGTLAYYAPWGDVVLFYGECGGASGLYELGEAVSGADLIETLSGEIQIDIVSGE